MDLTRTKEADGVVVRCWGDPSCQRALKAGKAPLSLYWFWDCVRFSNFWRADSDLVSDNWLCCSSAALLGSPLTGNQCCSSISPGRLVALLEHQVRPGLAAQPSSALQSVWRLIAGSAQA